MASNTAAWLTAAKVTPLDIKPAPLGVPLENQILVRNHAIAVNPIDWKLQSFAIYPLEYPVILGEDVAGEVVAVGPNVTRFKIGDRVIGVAAGFDTKKNEDKAFQAYTILQTNMASEIPNNLSYNDAVVLPLGLATAAAGLFQEDYLNLQSPTQPRRESTGQTLLVWGGATSVGSNAIQLAIAAGYEVISTASPKNFDYVKKLGASQVFDYNNPTVVSDILDALRGKKFAGVYDAVGGAAWAPSVEIVSKAEGKKFVATVMRGFPDPPEGVGMKQLQAVTIMHNNVGKACWQDFLPGALAAGTYIPAPSPVVAGHGLEHIQTALNLLGEGVSAQKIIVTL